MGKRRLLGIILLLSALALVSCQAPASSMPDASSEAQESITVAAAADLRFAFAEIGELYQKETGRKVIFTFGSTGMLATQVENGAPIDVFAAANVQFVDDLRAKGLVISDSQQLYAVGRIVLASNKKSDVAVRKLGDLIRPEVKKIAIANPEHAPYGAAAKQALEATGLWDVVKPKLVFGENIAQTVQYVQTGNVDAGIIALSVANVPEIDYVLIDESLHAPLKQALAVVSSTKKEKAAREFIAFINGPEGRLIMKKYGFLLPNEF